LAAGLLLIRPLLIDLSRCKYLSLQVLELASVVHALTVLNHAMPKPTDGTLEAILHKACLEAPEIHAACNCG